MTSFPIFSSYYWADPTPVVTSLPLEVLPYGNVTSRIGSPLDFTPPRIRIQFKSQTIFGGGDWNENKNDADFFGAAVGDVGAGSKHQS